MQDLMKTNCLEVNDTIIIVGSCIERMQPEAYKELEKISNNIYEVCLEKEHLNMVITKLIGMVSRAKLNKIIFATDDKSPHCIQLHCIIKEIKKAIDLNSIKVLNYVAVDNKLIEIPNEIISLSKNFSKLLEFRELLYNK